MGRIPWWHKRDGLTVIEVVGWVQFFLVVSGLHASGGIFKQCVGDGWVQGTLPVSGAHASGGIFMQCEGDGGVLTFCLVSGLHAFGGIFTQLVVHDWVHGEEFVC